MENSIFIDTPWGVLDIMNSVLGLIYKYILKMVQQILPEEVYKAIQNKDDFVLLDVRTTEEYGRSRLTSSVNIPVDDIEKNVENTIPEKTKMVVAYCVSRARSEVSNFTRR